MIPNSASALAAIFAASLAGCGARSALDVGGTSTPQGALPCADGAPGQRAWQAKLPTDQIFTGPFAADDEGGTYYLGTTGGTYPTAYTILALDACGAQRWRSSARPPAQLNGAGPDLVVDGDRVLFQWGTVDAFDRATGGHLWNADLDAWTGERLALDDNAEIGPIAVASDGTTFLVMTYATHAVMLSVDTSGTIATVADVTGDTGDISGFIVDAAGHLDVLWNSVAGAIVTSYTRGGEQVFSQPFTCQTQFLGPLAAGSSFVVMQSAACAMRLDGTPLFAPPEGDSADIVTLDAESDLYLAGQGPIVSLDASGHTRWTTQSTDFVASAALVVTGSQLVAAQLPASVASMASPLAIVVYDAGSGAELARYPTGVVAAGGLIPTIPTLVTAAGQVVLGLDGEVTAIAVGQTPDPAAQWPTGSGGVDHRNVALGQ